MTYTELVSAIQAYTENYDSDFESYIPTFIRQTETRIYNAVQLPSIRRNSTGINAGATAPIKKATFAGIIWQSETCSCDVGYV
jgi:hypothetical protein